MRCAPCASRKSGRASAVYDIVGPICETADFLARTAGCAKEGDLLAVMSSGAYAMSMASNYNSPARAAEVSGAGHRGPKLVRARESAGAAVCPGADSGMTIVRPPRCLIRIP